MKRCEDDFAQGDRVGVVSLGCARNTVDSEKMLADAKARGAIISPVEKASIVLVNTCGFTKEAKEESIDVILGLIEKKKRGRIKKIVVAGCLSERYMPELKKALAEVDAFMGIADFKEDFKIRHSLTPSHYAYIKICEGCANNCSYCAIPLIKGPLRSRSEASILDEVRKLSDDGVRELIVIGQDITMYGKKRSHASSLAVLLKSILKNSRIPWIRLLYLNPLRIESPLLDLMADEKRIVPYIDMPLQHVNDRILRLMNRKMGKTDIVSAIENIRRRLKRVSLRTSFIVGFPSETDEEFKELCSFVRSVRFDKLGVFKYSREEGTKAYKMEGQIADKKKERRYDILMSMQKDISASLLSSKSDRIVEVIVDEHGKTNKDYICRSVWDAPEVDGVFFLNAKKILKPGDIVRVRVTDTLEYDLVGELV